MIEEIAKLKRERNKWKKLAEDRKRNAEAVFRNLYQWERANSRNGKINRPWIVTLGDIAHLERWHKDLDTLAVQCREREYGAPLFKRIWNALRSWFKRKPTLDKSP